MTRQRVTASAQGDDAELWQQLAWAGGIGSRLAPEMTPGCSVQIADRWLELDASALTPGGRVEALIRTCVELGASESRVRELVQHANERASRPGAADARRRRAEQCRRLTAG